MHNSENVLKEVKQDEPGINTILIKSNNASSYHGNHSAEINHLLYKHQKINLLQYDFNEPSKGKDQCDREAVSAKNLLRSYIDARHDVQLVEDIYNTLHYAHGLRTLKVCIVEIDKKKTIMKSRSTKVSNFHSVSLQ